MRNEIDISLILPAFNEAATIVQTIRTNISKIGRPQTAIAGSTNIPRIARESVLAFHAIESYG